MQLVNDLHPLHLVKYIKQTFKYAHTCISQQLYVFRIIYKKEDC